jgi:hypothetical protein
VSRPLGVSIVVSILVVLYDLHALFLLLIGLGLIVGRGFFDVSRLAVEGTSVLALASAAGGFYLILFALAIMIAGFFFWKGYAWAHFVFIVLSAVFIVTAMMTLLAAASQLAGIRPLLPVLGLILNVLSLMVLNIAPIKAYCRRIPEETTAVSAGATAPPVERPLSLALVVILYEIAAFISVILAYLIGYAPPGGIYHQLGLLGAAFPSGVPAAMRGLVTLLEALTVPLGLGGVMIIILGGLLWNGYKGVRIVFIALAAVGVLGSLAGIVSKAPVMALLGLIVNVLSLILLNTRAAKEYCRL